MNLIKIEQLLKNHEERLSALENKLEITKTNSVGENKSPDFSGLSGGIRYLITDGFFDSPRSLREIFDKLKENAYYYDKSAVQKTVAIYFMKRDKILTRFKVENAWKYVIKK